MTFWRAKPFTFLIISQKKGLKLYLSMPLRIQRFANSLFPYCINHWETLDSKTKSSISVRTFKNKIKKRIRSKPRFCCNRNRLHKFELNFQISVITDLIMISTAEAPHVLVALKTRLQPIIFYAIPATTTFSNRILARHLKSQILMYPFYPKIISPIFSYMEAKLLISSAMNLFSPKLFSSLLFYEKRD